VLTLDHFIGDVSSIETDAQFLEDAISNEIARMACKTPLEQLLEKEPPSRKRWWQL
jgi:hypothetical protein